MQHQPRLQALADLDAEIAKAEAEVARWVRMVERMGAAGEPTRAARGFLRVAQDDLERLDRQRDALLGDDEERQSALPPLWGGPWLPEEPPPSTPSSTSGRGST